MPRWPRLAVVLTALVLAPAAQAEPPHVSIRFDPDSGRLAIAGLGHGRLTESRRPTGGPGGRLGFEAGAAWYHATGVERESRVGEGPAAPGDYPILSSQVPPWGIRQRADATYFPMPWLLSTRGYGKRTEGVVRLADRSDRYHLLVFPRGRSSTRFAGTQVTTREGDRRWVLRIESKRTRRYAIEASLATLRRPFVPDTTSIQIDGPGSAEVSDDPRTGALAIPVRAADARIVAAAR